MITVNVNGTDLSLDAAPDMPLLWALRDVANMTGTKYGCGVAACGACTVLMDGAPVRSCSLTLESAAGTKIITIEGTLGDDAVAKAVHAAWMKLDVVQCGYCQSGQIVSAIALLNANKTPSDDDIVAAMDGNLCRCGTYQRIKAAVKDAASMLG
jgi:isoquinoline 1-oxidoreductase subunit alpha